MFMLKIILIKSIKYLSALVNIFETNKVGSNKYKNIRKSRNKIVKILAKSKS